MKALNIVVDNDTQAIYVDGKKWEKSPESYMQLRPSLHRRSVGPVDIIRAADAVNARLAIWPKLQENHAKT